MGGNVSRIIAVAMKDLKLLSRDRADCFFTFVFPLAIAMFFGYVFGGGGGGGKMNIAVADLDGGSAAVAFVNDLEADPALKLTRVATVTEGEALVQKGKVTACVIVPKGFEEASGSILSGGGLVLRAVVDPTRTAEAGLLEGKLNEIGFKQMARTFQNPVVMDKNVDQAKRDIAKAPGLNPVQRLAFATMFDAVANLSRSGAVGGNASTTPAPAANLNKPDEMKGGAATGTTDSGAASGVSGGVENGTGGWRPVRVEVTKLATERVRPQSSFEISFPQGMVWGLMGCVMAFASSLAEERTRGTITRLTTSPLTMGQILAGKALACFFACVLVQVILIGFAIFVYNARFAHPELMALAVFAAAVGFTGIMMFLAGLSKTEGAAQGYGRAAVLILAMIGGGSIPVFFMPPLLQTLSGISPFKWVVDAIEGAMWRGTGFADVALPVAILFVLGVAGYLGGVMAIKMNARRA